MSNSSSGEDSDIYTNPYHFGRPVSDEVNFAGREEELEEIQYYLSQARFSNYFHIAVTGNRGVGKSSLLNVVDTRLQDEDFLPVKLRLNTEVVQSQMLFFKEILEEIIAEGAEQGKIKDRYYEKFRNLIDGLNPEVEIPLGFGSVYIGAQQNEATESTDVPQRVLQDDLEEIYRKAEENGVTSIVVLLDEADALAANRTILQKLRNVFSEVEGYNLILVGTEEMFEQLNDVFSPISRSFKKITLTSFDTSEETKECIVNPLSEIEEEALDDQCIREIHKITDVSPYEINLIAHHMYKRYEERGSGFTLSPLVLDDVAEELDRIRESGHYEIADAIKRLLPDQLEMVIAALEFPDVSQDWLIEYSLLNDVETLEPENLAASRSSRQVTVDHLMEQGILEEDDGEVRFAGGQFDITYLKYYAVSQDVLADAGEFVPGHSEFPLGNLQRKLVENVLLSNIFEEYRVHTMFDHDVEGRFGNSEGRIFTMSAHLTIPAGESRTMVELSHEEQEKFYKNLPNAVRFRCNVNWMSDGFVTQVRFLEDFEVQTEQLRQRLESLHDRLVYLDYELMFEDEIDLYNAAIEASEEDDWLKARGLYGQSIDVNKSFERAWANKGLIHKQLGETEEALRCFDKALELRTGWAQVLKKKGILLIEEDRFQEAVEILMDATDQNPGDWNAWHNRGRALMNTAEVEDAVTCFERAEMLVSENPLPRYARGLCLLELGEVEAATEIFEQLLEGENNQTPPSKAEVRHNYAITLSLLDRFEEALEHYEQVVKEQPDNQQAWLNKANCEIELGRAEAALSSFEHAGVDVRPNADAESVLQTDLGAFIEPIEESEEDSES